MRLSEGVEWSLHCCGLLGALPPGYAIPASRLAEYHGVPAAYLAKHLQSLSRAGIVESVQGPRGGYRMARPAAEVTVHDVVEAVEGGEPAFRCTEIRQQGPCAVDDADAYRKPCGIARIMGAAESAWRRELRRHTVADLVMGAVEEAPRAQVEGTIVWIQEVAR